MERTNTYKLIQMLWTVAMSLITDHTLGCSVDSIEWMWHDMLHIRMKHVQTDNLINKNVHEEATYDCTRYIINKQL